MISTVIVLSCVTLALGWLLLSAHARFKDDDDELIDAIDALLPQTQCAQCGYPGCRPYAEAVAAGAAIDLCPPGGNATFEGLQALLGRGEGASPPAPEPVLARIREAECIGCFLCIRACPVDAIIGAPGYMHTVIEDECTGCELCVPACPVDCIDLLPAVRQASEPAPQSALGAPAAGIPVAGPEGAADRDSKLGTPGVDLQRDIRLGGSTGQTHTPSLESLPSTRASDLLRDTGPGGPTGQTATPSQESLPPSRASAKVKYGGWPCIGCNRCEPVCPAKLAPRELLWLSNAGKWDAASGLGLGRCIECRLCDRACPSEIPLAATFAVGKQTLAETAARNAQAAHAKSRFEARTARLASEQDAAQARRAERLARQRRPAETGEATPP